MTSFTFLEYQCTVFLHPVWSLLLPKVIRTSCIWLFGFRSHCSYGNIFLFPLEWRRFTRICCWLICILLFDVFIIKGWRRSFLKSISYELSDPFDKIWRCFCFKSFTFRAHDCYNFYFLFLQRDLISCFLDL